MTSASERRTHGMVQGLACQVPQEGELMAWYRDLHVKCIRKENSWHGTGTCMSSASGRRTHGMVQGLA